MAFFASSQSIICPFQLCSDIIIFNFFLRLDAGTDVTAGFFIFKRSQTVIDIITFDRDKVFSAKLALLDRILIIDNHIEHIREKDAEMFCNNRFAMQRGAEIHVQFMGSVNFVQIMFDICLIQILLFCSGISRHLCDIGPVVKDMLLKR